MQFLIATILKDLARWRRDSTAILIYIGIPLMIGGLMTLMFDRSDGGGPAGTLLIADQDESLLSGFVTSAYSQGDMADLLGVQNVSVEEGTQLIEAGDASGFLIIPAGFQDAFLNETPVVLTLKTNPSQTILPGIIEDITEILLDAGFYLQVVFGPEIESINRAGELDSVSDLFVSETAVDIGNKFETLGPLLSEPLFDLEIVEPPPTEPRPDIGLLFLPGIVMMALMFAAQGLSSDYWTERDSGALRRLVSSPDVLRRFVLGKTAAAAMLIAAIGGFTLLLGFLYHGLAWGKYLPSLLWVLLSGAGLFSWFAAIQMLTPSSKAANLLTTILIFPLLMMGGSFFPLDVLPDWLSSIGRLSPNGFMADRLTSELTSDTMWSIDGASWGVLVAMTLTGVLISSWRLQTGFARRS